MSNNLQLPWHEPSWIQHAHEWIHTETQRQSMEITGDIEQPHLYPWSTVLIVPTNEGRLFFKATASETIFEAALTRKLAEWYPDCMPELVAVDTARGWMLMRDGGEQLRTYIRPTQDLAPWEPVISRYAEIQVGLIDHIPEILALGIPDHRLAALPTLFSELLTDESSLMIDREKGLMSAEFQQVHHLTLRFGQICADLAAIGIPESLNNGDLHDGNVLLKNRRITFFDWGDSTVTHPFVSLRTFFVGMEISLKMEGDYPPPTPEMIALLHRYLECWERFAAKEQLLAAYQLSRPVASIVKALLWHSTISTLEGPLREEYAWIVPELLREFMVYEKMLDDGSM